MEQLPVGIRDGYPYDHGQVFWIEAPVRRKHMAIFGSTGAGKSTLLRNMIAWDIHHGLGVTVVDPHGALIEDLLDNHIPRDRTNDVIYLNPKDPEWALGLNILEAIRPEQRALVVSQVVGIFHKLWGESWGPRMEDILRNALFVLVEQPQPVSLVALPKLLTDRQYRQETLGNVTNPVVKHFFETTYEAWNANFREEAISPVLNKVRAFLTDPLLRGIIGQARSSFDFRWMMDSSKILLCDLSKGSIGEDNANLLGSLVVVKEKLAALSRQDVLEAERVPHVLYVEEAQSFVGDFPSILSEARKYGLALVLVTQGVQQLSGEAALSVFANCATVITFRVGGTDAEELRQQFAMTMPASNLQDLPDYKIYVRTLLTDEAEGAARPTGPHLVKAFPPFSKEPRNAERLDVQRTSSERYLHSRREVEENLSSFLGF